MTPASQPLAVICAIAAIALAGTLGALVIQIDRPSSNALPLLAYGAAASGLVLLVASLTILRAGKQTVTGIDESGAERTPLWAAPDEAADVTKPRTAARQPHENRQALHAILENVPLAIHVTDLDGRYVMLNEAFARVYRTDPASIIGKKFADIDPERPAIDPSAFREADTTVISTRRPVVFEAEFQARGGDVSRLEITKFPVLDEMERVVGVGSVESDITDRHNMMLELVDARHDAEDANRAKSEFLATMSHEFRTPLNAILGFSEMLRSEYLGPIGSEQYREYADDIQHSGRHLLTLINDLLDISAIEAKKRSLSFEEIDLRDLLQDCLRNTKGLAADKSLTVELDADDRMPPLYADRRAIVQIVLNLVANAIKFTEAGGFIAMYRDGYRLTLAAPGLG